MDHASRHAEPITGHGAKAPGFIPCVGFSAWDLSLVVDRQLLEQPYREERPDTGRVQTRIRLRKQALALPTA